MRRALKSLDTCKTKTWGNIGPTPLEYIEDEMKTR